MCLNQSIDWAMHCMFLYKQILALLRCQHFLRHAALMMAGFWLYVVQSHRPYCMSSRQQIHTWLSFVVRHLATCWWSSSFAGSVWATGMVVGTHATINIQGFILCVCVRGSYMQYGNNKVAWFILTTEGQAGRHSSLSSQSYTLCCSGVLINNVISSSSIRVGCDSSSSMYKKNRHAGYMLPHVVCIN